MTCWILQSIPKVEDRPLLVVLDCLFGIFIKAKCLRKRFASGNHVPSRLLQKFFALFFLKTSLVPIPPKVWPLPLMSHHVPLPLFSRPAYSHLTTWRHIWASWHAGNSVDIREVLDSALDRNIDLVFVVRCRQIPGSYAQQHRKITCDLVSTTP